MKTRPSTTAILLFARTADHENNEKWLPRGKEIYTLLNDRARNLAKASGLPFFHITEHEQVGEDFGSRFSHALQQIFSQGFTSIISIGNDTPQLTQNDIRIALDQIRAKNPVIGPSKDGGIYLLGIHANDFDKQQFRTLNWCTSRVQENLGTYFRSRGKTPLTLSAYQDLDCESDIQYLSNIRDIIPYGILNLLRRAVRQILLGFEWPNPYTFQPLWQPHLNKGSPR